MIKHASATSFVSVILFTAFTYTYSKFVTTASDGAKFGWPLVFFSTDPEKEIMAGNSFSLFNLSVDLMICIAMGFLIVQLLSLDKRRKKRLA